MDPLPAPQSSFRGARHILVAAALTHISLFVFHARFTFIDLVTPRPTTSADRMGPFTAGFDAVGYYAWLRSPLIDGDFEFADEFTPAYARIHGPGAEFPRAATGRTTNQWPVGPALVWAPAVVTVHLALRVLGSHSPWPADGFSAPYQFAVGGTTFALAMLTLVLAYRIARRFAGPTAAASGAALLTLATPLIAYGSVETSMAHGPASAALAAFVFVWLRTFGSTRAGRWAALGGLLGLASLIRWQLSTFAVLPALEALWLLGRADGWAARGGVVARLALTGLVAAVALAPQFAAKQVVYGDPFGGFHKTAQNWLAPSLTRAVFSTDRGFFYWTPVTLPALAGLAWAAVRLRRPALGMLAVGVAVQLYAVGALLGGEAFLGGAFGFRILTETCVLLGIGAAVLLDRAGPRAVPWLVVCGGLLVMWNLLLLGVHRHAVGCIAGGSPAEVFAAVEKLVRLRPSEGVGSASAAGLLTFVMLSALRADRVPAAVPEQSRVARAA